MSWTPGGCIKRDADASNPGACWGDLADIKLKFTPGVGFESGGTFEWDSQFVLREGMTVPSSSDSFNNRVGWDFRVVKADGTFSAWQAIGTSSVATSTVTHKGPYDVRNFCTSCPTDGVGLQVRVYRYDAQNSTPYVSEPYGEAATTSVGMCPGVGTLSVVSNSTVNGTTKIELGWSSVDGIGAEGTGYDLQRREGANGTWQTVKQYRHTASGEQPPLGYGPFAAVFGRVYEFRLKAIGATCDGDWTPTLTVTAGDGETPTTPGDGGSVDPDGTDGDGDGASDESCGWNPFCWVKAALAWAFIPGEDAWGAWESFYNELRVTPPFSIIIGGFDFVLDFIDDVKWRYDTASGSSWCYNLPDPADPQGSTVPACMGNAFTQIADNTQNGTWLSYIRWILSGFLLWATFSRLWTMGQAAFGRSSGQEIEPASSAETEGRNDE